MTLPELDIARVRRWCAARVPEHARHQVRVECEATPSLLTIVERRAPWRENDGPEWSTLPIARLRYTAADTPWTLFQLMGANGRTHTGGSGAPLADYPGFGQPVLAPVDGRVVEITDDYPDAPPGTNGESANTIVLDIGERYLVLGHLKQGSVIVQVGDEVRGGEPLAAVGNSGHTNEPHLHLHIQDSPTAREDAMHTYPVVFRNADVTRGGPWPFGDRGELRTGDVLGTPAR